MYSTNDQEILLRWQRAKLRHTHQWMVEPQSPLDEPIAQYNLTNDEYLKARNQLKSFEDPGLRALGKWCHPAIPNVNLSSKDGYELWCRVERDMHEAEMELFNLGRGIKDLFPSISTAVQ